MKIEMRIYAHKKCFLYCAVSTNHINTGMLNLSIGCAVFITNLINIGLGPLP